MQLTVYFHGAGNVLGRNYSPRRFQLLFGRDRNCLIALGMFVSAPLVIEVHSPLRSIHAGLGGREGGMQVSQERFAHMLSFQCPRSGSLVPPAPSEIRKLLTARAVVNDFSRGDRKSTWVDS